jgi:hypothetical protein
MATAASQQDARLNERRNIDLGLKSKQLTNAFAAGG